MISWGCRLLVGWRGTGIASGYRGRTPRRSPIVKVSPPEAGQGLLKHGPRPLSRDPLSWLVPPPGCEGHFESVWSVRRRGERTDT